MSFLDAFERSSSITETTPLISRQDDGDEALSEDADGIKILWGEMRTLATYALPISGAEIIDYSLVFVPVISVGHISTHALAAISMGSTTANVSGLSILQGLVTALDAFLPATWTSSQPHLMGLWAQRMWVVLTCTTIPIIIFWWNAEKILLGLRQDPEVARLAALYLRYLSFGLPAYGFNIICRRYFQSQGLFSLQTSIICTVAPINVLINYLLVWGPESIRLGFIGAPISTVTSQYLVSIISLLCGIFYVPRTGWHPITTQMFTNLGVLFRLGLSGIGQIASEWWAWEAVALAASFLGPTALASQSVIITTESVIFQATFGLAEATAIRLGNVLGQKRARRAEVVTNASMASALILSSVACVVLVTCRHSWAYIFSSDPGVVETVAKVIPIIALYQLVEGNASMHAGIRRAKGDQFIGALLNASAYYIIGLPIGIWLAFRAKLGLQGLWIGLAIALAYCAAVSTYLSMKTDWDWEVQKVIHRLEGEAQPNKLTDEESRVAGSSIEI